MTPDLPDGGVPGVDPEAVERAVRNAGVFLRRGDLASAERECQSASALAPDDAAVHELYGDILLARGDREGARDRYKRAVELAPGASSPEMKYARLVLNLGEEAWVSKRRQETLESPGSEKPEPVRNTTVPLLASALWPGLGQWYNGDNTKAIILASVYGFVMLVLLITGDLRRLLEWFLMGFSPGGAQQKAQQVSVIAALLWGGAAMAWLYAVIDAGVKASQNTKKPKDPFTEPDF